MCRKNVNFAVNNSDGWMDGWMTNLLALMDGWIRDR